MELARRERQLEARTASADAQHAQLVRELALGGDDIDGDAVRSRVARAAQQLAAVERERGRDVSFCVVCRSS